MYGLYVVLSSPRCERTALAVTTAGTSVQAEDARHCATFGSSWVPTPTPAPANTSPKTIRMPRPVRFVALLFSVGDSNPPARRLRARAIHGPKATPRPTATNGTRKRSIGQGNAPSPRVSTASAGLAGLT